MAIDDAIGGGFDPKQAIDDLISQQDGTSATGVSPDLLANRLYRKLKQGQQDRQQRRSSEPDFADEPVAKPKKDAPDFSSQGVPADSLPDFSSEGIPADQVQNNAPAPSVSLGVTGQAKAALKGIPRGAVDQAGGILKGLGVASAEAQREETPDMMASVGGVPPDLVQQMTPQAKIPTQQQPYYRAGQAVQDFADRNIPMTDQEKESIGGRVGQGIGAVAPYLAAGAAGPLAGVAAGGLGMASSTAADTFDEAVKKGASEEKAAAAAGYAALAGGALGTLPLGMVLKPIRIASPMLSGRAAGYLEEAVKSGLTFAGVGEAQEYLLQRIAKDYYDPEAGYSPDAKRAIASLVTGGLLGAGGHFMERRARRAMEASAGGPESAGPGPAGIGGPAGPDAGGADTGAGPSGGPSGGPTSPGSGPEPRPEAERSGVGREKLEKILRYYGYTDDQIKAMSHSEMAEAVLREMKGNGPQAKPTEQAAPEQPQPRAQSKPEEQPQASKPNASSTEATEREGLRRYGWTDDEIDAMSPAQRRREFQTAMETGQSEKPEDANLRNSASSAPEQPQPEAKNTTEQPQSATASSPEKVVPETSGRREEPIVPKTAEDVRRAQPVEPVSGAQAAAENYQHAHIELPQLGLEGARGISVETGVGQERKGVDSDGKPWSVKLTHAAYGRIKGTKGADGQPLDIFIGPKPTSPHVFVVDQHHPGGGGFDEHKILAGFNDPQSALRAYAASYTDHGEGRIGHVTAMGPGEFQQWLAGDTTKPLKKAPDSTGAAEPGNKEGPATERSAAPAERPKETPTRGDEAGANSSGGSADTIPQERNRSSANPGNPGALSRYSGGNAEPLSLLQFIASKGGLAPHPELGAIGLTGDHRVQIPGRRGFFGVVRPTGDKLDMIREAAEEAGYLRGEHNKTSTVRDLLDAIDNELRGQRHAAEGEEGHTTKKQQGSLRERSEAAREKAIAAAREDIAAEYSDLPEDLLDRAAEVMADERLDIDTAVEMAAMRLVSEDADYGVSERDLEDIYGEDVSDEIRPRPASADGGPSGEQRAPERGSAEGEEAGGDGAPVRDLGEAGREETPARAGETPTRGEVIDRLKAGETSFPPFTTEPIKQDRGGIWTSHITGAGLDLPQYGMAGADKDHFIEVMFGPYLHGLLERQEELKREKAEAEARSVNGIDPLSKEGAIREAVERMTHHFTGAADKIRKAIALGAPDADLLKVIKEANRWNDYGGSSIAAGSAETRAGRLNVHMYGSSAHREERFSVTNKDIVQIARELYTEPTTERIEGPAIKVGDKIYQGQTHSDALDRAAKEVDISPDDFLAQIEGHDNVGLDGFVTSDGRFLTRKEAYALIERTEAGEQTVLPGAEKIGQGEQAQRKANEKLKPSKPQKPADEGLFGDERNQTDLLDHMRTVETALGEDAGKVAPVDVARAAEIMAENPGMDVADAFGQAVIKNAVEQGFLTEQEAVGAYGEEVKDVLESGREGASGGSAHADEGGAEPDAAIAGGGEEGRELSSSGEAGAQQGEGAAEAEAGEAGPAAGGNVAHFQGRDAAQDLAAAEAAWQRSLKDYDKAHAKLRRELGRALTDEDERHPNLIPADKAVAKARNEHGRAIMDAAYHELAPTLGDKYRLVRKEDNRAVWSAPAREWSERTGEPDMEYSMEVVRNSDGAVMFGLPASGIPYNDTLREGLRAVQANEDYGSAIETALQAAEATLPKGDNVSVLHKPDMSDIAAQLEDATRHRPGAGEVVKLPKGLGPVEKANAIHEEAIRRYPEAPGPKGEKYISHEAIAFENGARGHAWDAAMPIHITEDQVRSAYEAGREYAGLTRPETPEEWWKNLTVFGRKDIMEQAGINRPARVLWKYLSDDERARLIEFKDEGGDRGVQAPVPASDAGAGPEAVQPAQSGGQASGAGRPEGGRGERPVQGADAGRAEGEGRVSEAAVGERSGGAGARDADRLPESRTDDAASRRAKRAVEQAANNVEGENHVIEPGGLEEGRTPKNKALGNIQALELANKILAEDRPATAAEQKELALYVGWGGLKNAFPDAQGNFSDDMFHTIGHRLQAALSPEEYATARRSIQYAHYTAESVVRGMWDAVQRLGFKGGQIFEPGMGTGNFAGMMPADIAANSHYSGIELDHTTARIAKLLYPKWGIRQDDFTKTKLPANTFDLVIGNPPFADISIQSDPAYKQGFLLHDYFFAKSIDAVRPGGLLAFVTSAGTMNKIDPSARQYLADRAAFVGAIRLPGDAFQKNAGTKVTTDIIFLRKKLPGEIEVAPHAWTSTANVELPNKNGEPVIGAVNQYFLDHPEMVLGEHGFFDPLYENRYGVRSRPGQDLSKDLATAIERLPQDVMTDWQDAQAESVKVDMDSTEKKEGSYYVGADGVLHQQRGGAGFPVKQRGKGVEGGKTAADIERIKGLVPIRDALRDVYSADLAGDAATAARAREALNKHYDAFVEKFGPINKAVIRTQRPSVIQLESARQKAREDARYAGEPWNEGSFDDRKLVAQGASVSVIARERKAAREAALAAGREFDEGSFDPDDVPDLVIDKRPNVEPFMDDPESYRLRAIERYDEGTGQGHKSPVFFENVITREKKPDIKSHDDALLYSLSKFGRVNIPEMAKMLRKSESEVIEGLGEKVFQVPGTNDAYETRDEYLSGNVKKKLALAQKAAERNPAFRRNVDALEAAQPTPLAPSQIRAVIGMPWIPAETVEGFALDALGLEKASVKYLAPLAQWVVSGDTSSVAATSTYGTEDRRAPALLEDALNRRNPKIYDQVMVEGKLKPILNVAKTQAAQDKVKAIQEKFADWIWSDQERSDRLAGMYNDRYNNLVVRDYDGSYLTTPGIAATWSWRPHQKRVIARIIQSGNTYVAHAVGAGKTSEYIGAIMEMRRLGLVRKPMVTVPNHMLAQFTKEWYEQYPMAKLAIADDHQFHTDRRKQFIANVAMEDLDAVIITHSAFGMIPVSEKFQNSLIQREIVQYRELLSQLQGGDNRITRSRVEKQIERLEQRLIGKGTTRKDSVFTFEEMGIDHLTVDEAHLFRKLDFSTQMSNLKGIDPDGSAMAWDLYVKAQYLDQLRPGRSLVLGSGTPITNTMAELFTVQRFMQPQVLAERGLDKFDAWAGTFGESKAELEQDAAGKYKPVTRFSRFMNVAELSKMVRQFMDVVTSKQLEQYVTRPQLKGGKRRMVIAEQSPEQQEFQARLDERMKAIEARRGPPQKGDDIMLTVIGDGRMAAIDIRLVGEPKASEPSKLDLMVDKVFENWKATKRQPFHRPAQGGGYEPKPAFHGPATQIVFANLGLSGKRGFAVPAYIRSELTRRGIPESEIAYIYDFKNQTQKQRLFNDMNEGKVRVLIGSVAKMGVGTNVQKRLYAIHNLDPLWYPADDEQRNGRGIRQGNMNPEIEINDYSTHGTYDSVMWGLMAKKARFIQDFFEGDPNLRDMEDLGEASQYEQAKAMTTSDPRIMQLTELKHELERAQRRKTAFDSEVYAMRQRRADEKSKVEHYSKRIEETKQDIAQRVDTTGDAFKAKVGGQSFDKRTDFIEALWDRTGDLLEKGVRDKAVKVGEIGGFPIMAEKRKSWAKNGADEVHLWLQMNGPDRRRDIDASTPRGTLQSMEATLRNLPHDLTEYQTRLAKSQKFVAESEGKTNAKFEGDAEINRLTREVRRLEAELEGKDKQKGEGDELALRPEVLAELTPEAQRLVGGIEKLLKSIIRRVAGDSVAVQFEMGGWAHSGKGYDPSVDSSTANASYSPSRALIRLGLFPGRADEMAMSAYHEAYHHVENRLQSPQERELMKRETPRIREWLKGKTGLTDKQVDGLAGYEVRAIAFQLYSHYRDNGTAEQRRSTSGIHMTVRRWFERLMDILRKVANGLRGMGFKTYEDIFRETHEGEAAGRKPSAESNINADDMAAMSDIFRRRQDDAINTRLKDLMTSTLADRFVERFQNLSRPVEKLQDAVEAKLNGTLPDSQAFAQKKKLFPGKVGALVEDFNKTHLDPLIDFAREKHLSEKDVGDILYALHAAERNARMEEINHPALDGSDRDYIGRRSGMSDAEAAEILSRQDPAVVNELDRLAGRIRDFNLDMQVRSGLISQATADNYRQQYEHYVPLSGWDVAPEDQDQQKWRAGGAFNVRGKETQQAFGRKSKAQNPLINLLEQSYRTIDRAKKNEYIRSAYTALSALDDAELKGFVRFDQGKPKKAIDPMTGLVTQVEDPFYRNEPGAVGFKIGGNQRYMIFDNPETGEAIKRMHAEGLGMFQPLLDMQNKVKALWTHYSPDFLFRHFIFRYPIEGTLNSFEQKESGEHSIGRYVKESFPFLGSASKAIFAEKNGRELTGDGAEMQRYWREMREAGGSMTFRSMRDTDLLREHLEKKLSSLTRSKWQTVKDKAHAFTEAMDAITNPLDNALRLAAYASARRQGKTPEQAAVIARDATVDFQEAGRWKNAVGLWAPFGNIAIQTGARMWQAVSRSRIMRRVFMGTMLAGFLSGMFNYLFGGDDKDGIPFFDKIPEWDRHLNFITLSPATDSKGRPVPIKIPMPYNWAFPFTIGSAFATMLFGKRKHKAKEMLALVTKAGVEAATPFGAEQNRAAAVAPELARPFVHVYTNKNWNGVPVHQDETFQKGPNSYSGRKTTGDGWKYIAQSMNDATGGDKRHQGALDFYPEDLRLLFDYIGGSQRRLLENIGTTATSVARGESPDLTHVPLARVVTGTDYDAADRARRYERMDEEKHPWKR